MTKFQKITAATAAPIGAPGDLPPELVGLSDESLADLSWVDEALGYAGVGFIPVAEPAPPAMERIAKVYLLNRFTKEEERRFAKLQVQASTLSVQDLDNPEKDDLFEIQRFLRRFDAVSVIELNSPQTLAAFERLRQLGVFGDPLAADSAARRDQILTPAGPDEK